MHISFGVRVLLVCVYGGKRQREKVCSSLHVERVCVCVCVNCVTLRGCFPFWPS